MKKGHGAPFLYDIGGTEKWVWVWFYRRRDWDIRLNIFISSAARAHGEKKFIVVLRILNIVFLFFFRMIGMNTK